MRYNNAQGLRAIAASLVLSTHSGILVGMPPELKWLGHAGVDIFFVISGFIICQVAAHSDHGALEFLARRLWRVFPLYWVVLAVSATFSFFGFSVGYDGIPWNSAADYIFLLEPGNRLVPQAWTLVFELYFYVSIAVILLFVPRRHFYRALAIWTVAEIALIVVRGPNGGHPHTNALSLEFALGCFIAWLNDRGFVARGLIAGAIGLALFAAGDWWCVHIQPDGPTPLPRLLMFGVGSALCLYALISFERRGAMTFARPLVRLGDASYSLYLWHFPMIIFAVTFGIGPIMIPLTFVAALASYYWIEVPLLRVPIPYILRRAISQMRTLVCTVSAFISPGLPGPTRTISSTDWPKLEAQTGRRQ